MSTIEKSGVSAEVPQQRVALPIQRTHQRFLLRQLQFTQQYAAMYRCRLESLQQRALSALTAKINTSNPPNGESIPSLSPLLELQTGQRALCVGVIYKQMRLLPSFLHEYQKELVRIETGEEEDGVDKADAADILCDLPPSADDPDTPLGAGDAGSELLVGEPNKQHEQHTLCRTTDEVFIEDSSGRVLLENISPELLCTGLVISVDGTLHKNGCLKVHSYAMTDLRDIYIPRTLHDYSQLKPCYIAFVSGLELGYPQMEDPEVVRNRTMIELLVDYLSGNVGDENMTTQASQIARLVIAGNSIAPTDELKLKKKVKLDPSDHVRLGDDRRGTGVVNSAMLMSELDKILTRVADTIEVDLMPGDYDMSNAFQPQQPLHPLLLPEAARRSSLKLVTNPHEFSVFPNTSTIPKLTSTGKPTEGGTSFFISSGSSLNDVCRETIYPSRLDAMSMMLQSGCACPTAPNTLFSYPFKDSDPFLFQSAPHCFICCDQPEMQTRWESLESFGPLKDAAMDEEGYENNDAGVRLVCVPSFARTGVLVLVNVNSPHLDTVTVNFSSASNGTS
ncbi:putative DNA polymerase delta subunit 2 [Trypanosoma theileri]|uniref:Putative DNA polymerase delta subunit 2 n=1 Tax=Trypanosoma theileri TaxID=67003 RepID=A0A1X0NMG0_9TRYP|nr:putative DNA polymerase delta subunit 2 [Trypanosoma theileri]ORC85761.1 putative DNA polymerase delta subunit 2 [Trypanosoma theileri]